MNIQRVLLVLSLVNLSLVLFLLAETRRPTEATSATPILRGSALEIVDKQGRVRASIKVQPADSAVKMPNGRPYPETVVVRLSDPNGRPEVKLGGSEQGAGLGLVGEVDSASILLKAEGDETIL